jgi:hypothetical protein
VHAPSLDRGRRSGRRSSVRRGTQVLGRQRALDHIAATTGSEPHSEDIERLSPLGSDHITLTGRYRVLLPGLLHDRSAYRALNTPEDAAAA